MPFDGNRGEQGDMPALWALNGRIPRSAQYKSCSCWATGCGELDIFEVLDLGGNKCMTQIHSAKSPGNANWFARPVDTYAKVGVIFSEASASVVIVELPSDTDFSLALKDTLVESWVGN